MGRVLNDDAWSDPLNYESVGKLEMWVDIFPKSLPSIPPSISIEPRKPIEYQLRIVIWNTFDVRYDER